MCLIRLYMFFFHSYVAHFGNLRIDFFVMTCKSINRYEKTVLSDFHEMFVVAAPRNSGNT